MKSSMTMGWFSNQNMMRQLSFASIGLMCRVYAAAEPKRLYRIDIINIKMPQKHKTTCIALISKDKILMGQNTFCLGRSHGIIDGEDIDVLSEFRKKGLGSLLRAAQYIGCQATRGKDRDLISAMGSHAVHLKHGFRPGCDCEAYGGSKPMCRTCKTWIKFEYDGKEFPESVERFCDEFARYVSVAANRNTTFPDFVKIKMKECDIKILKLMKHQTNIQVKMMLEHPSEVFGRKGFKFDKGSRILSRNGVEQAEIHECEYSSEDNGFYRTLIVDSDGSNFLEEMWSHSNWDDCMEDVKLLY